MNLLNPGRKGFELQGTGPVCRKTEAFFLCIAPGMVVVKVSPGRVVGDPDSPGLSSPVSEREYQTTLRLADVALRWATQQIDESK